MIVPADTAAYSDAGPYRSRNEDQAECVADAAIFVVADGMGGTAGGEHASRTAVETLVTSLRRDAARPTDLEISLPQSEREAFGEAMSRIDSQRGPGARLRRAFLRAHYRVLEEGRRTGLERMATAAVVAQVVEGSVWVAHVGDCRAYTLSTDGRLTRLTEDHSLAVGLASQGLLPPGAESSPILRSRLTQMVGGEFAAEPDISIWTPERDDRLLLCTDGVWASLAEEAIATVLALEASPSDISRRLVEEAMAAGSRDNATALVVHFAAR